MDEIKEPEGMYPELNRELLVKVVDHALSAENWNQNFWYRENDGKTTCGTSMCIAGFTAIEFAGWKPVSDGLINEDTQIDFIARCEKDGEVELISAVARKNLGLTWEESSELFWAGNTPETIREITQDILDGVYRE